MTYKYQKKLKNSVLCSEEIRTELMFRINKIKSVVNSSSMESI